MPIVADLASEFRKPDSLCLPFSWYAVIDRELGVHLSGATFADLVPDTRALAPEIAEEVGALIRERWLESGTISTGLIGRTHGVRLSHNPAVGSEYYLVHIERLSIERGIERLVRNTRVDDREAEHLRLAIAGRCIKAIALRLGQTVSETRRREQSLLAKTGFTTRDSLIDGVFRLKRARTAARG